VKKLVGRQDIEEALQRLEKVTVEEARMAAAEALKAIHGVGDKVEDVVKAFGNRIEGMIQCVDNRVKGIGDVVITGSSYLFDLSILFSLFAPFLPFSPTKNNNNRTTNGKLP
jgi:hypothetical protein